MNQGYWNERRQRRTTEKLTRARMKNAMCTRWVLSSVLNGCNNTYVPTYVRTYVYKKRKSFGFAKLHSTHRDPVARMFSFCCICFLFSIADKKIVIFVVLLAHFLLFQQFYSTAMAKKSQQLPFRLQKMEMWTRCQFNWFNQFSSIFSLFFWYCAFEV